MIAVPNDTALATRLQLFCGTLDTRRSDVTASAFSRPMTDRSRWGECAPRRSPSVNTRVRERALLAALFSLEFININEIRNYSVDKRHIESRESSRCRCHHRYTPYYTSVSQECRSRDRSRPGCNPAQSLSFSRTALVLAITKLTRASQRCAASWAASIHRLHALDSPRNVPVAAVDLREVTLQSRPLPRAGERSRDSPCAGESQPRQESSFSYRSRIEIRSSSTGRYRAYSKGGERVEIFAGPGRRDISLTESVSDRK